MIQRLFILLTALAAGLASHGETLPDLKLISESVIDGRKTVRYEHASLDAWGYAKPQRDYFYVVHPETPSTGKTALQVILHSAGGSGEYEMQQAAGRKGRRNPLGFAADSNYGLHLDCRTNQPTDWWWGYHALQKDTARDQTKPGPTEQRMLATVAWVSHNFAIDTNRIYLSGGSMGGSGSLGLGMCHGDIFAAIAVLVPAGIGHVQYRMKNSPPADPPPILNCSSQTDAWAAGQEKFIADCQSNRHSMVFAWGLFGHGGPFAGYHPAATTFPWLDIRKNEAYPVFTGASTDNTYPGLHNTNATDQVGQINAYFRWKNITDTPRRLLMELRLVKKSELPKPAERPAESIADVTVRRAQQLDIKPGQVYKWQMGANQSGQVRVDANGWLTIPRVRITEAPTVLTVGID